MTGETGVELTAEFCARLGMAIGSAAGEGKIALGTAGGPAAVLGAALSAGLIGTGCRVWDFGSCIEPQFDYLVRYSGMRLGVYISGGSTSAVHLIGPDGWPASRALERKAEERLDDGAFVRTGWQTWREPMNMHMASRLYRQELVRMTAPLRPMELDIRGVDPSSVQLLSGVLSVAGCRRGEGLRLHLGPDARRLSLFEDSVGYIWPEQALAINCLLALKEGQQLVLPPDSPLAIEQLVERFGGTVCRYAGKESERSAPLWMRDGLMMAIRILCAISRDSCTLPELLKELPAFSVISRSVCCSDETEARFQAFCREEGLSAAEENGARVRRDNGTVVIRPSRSGKLLLLMAEAADSETAEELCGTVAGLLGGIPLDKDVKRG